MANYRKKIVVFALPVVMLASLAFVNVSYFEVTKNLDIFTTLYKELNTYYVDTLKPEKLLRSGITEMLTDLDPYTEFIPEEEMEDYRTQTTGRYGGIGALIGVKNDWVIITEPYEGFPAAKAGLRAGDRIVEVNGKSAKNFKTDQVSAMLKGKAGTEVNVKLMRLKADGKEEEVVVKMIREEIRIKNVPYYGMLKNNVGYILLAGFTDHASSEVKNALIALEAKGKLKGLVLDLRGNPGGLLNEAINVANVFVDKNIEIVSTKGKMESDWNKSFYTLNEPTNLKIPLVVMADGGSASAAEIVSGALQDLDRAVVVGERTFGKGLVQTTLSLPFNAKLKITTAKYYIPSGRCIQAINYAEKNDDGSVKRIADSLKVAFKTKNGRVVFDGGGVDPDVKTEGEKLSNIAISLVTKSLIFDYANLYRAKHEKISEASAFELSDTEYSDFVQWVKKQDYTYTTRSEKMLEEIEKTAAKEKYLDGMKTDFEAMKNTMQGDKQRDFDKEKVQLKSLLEEEIISRYYLTSGRIVASQKWDTEIQKAVEILSDEKKMKEILAKK